MAVTVTGAATGLPAPWTNRDIGSPALAGGATAAGGTFTVKVTDQYGAFDTQTINIDVAGSNDAPTIQPPLPVSPPLFEDSAATGASPIVP